jgi:hypothetical protein
MKGHFHQMFPFRGRISASLKESSLTVADVRGRINVGTIPDNSLDDRVNLFEHKILVA